MSANLQRESERFGSQKSLVTNRDLHDQYLSCSVDETGTLHARFDLILEITRGSSVDLKQEQTPVRDHTARSRVRQESGPRMADDVVVRELESEPLVCVGEKPVDNLRVSRAGVRVEESG